MPEKCEHREEIRWRPNRVVDGDLLMYLRAARSIAAFAGMCGGTAEDRCEAEAMDETTVNALDTLHKHNYDTSKSLQALVKGPTVMYIEKKWTEEEIKRFAKGLRHLGKNFFKIKKEHLPHKDTSELVEFYYFWKKSPAANNSRPTYRSRHRRQLKRQSPRISQPDHEVSSSGDSGEESEESEGSRDVASICQRCYTTNSKDWHNGKDGGVLCTKCRLSYKKYGEESGVESPPPSASPDQYLFKPVPEDEETTPSKHNMRTRRSNNTSSTNGKKKERNSVSSPDLEGVTPSTISSGTTPISTLTNSNKTGRKSPSNNTDKDGKKISQKTKDSSSGKAKKRRITSEENSALSKKKKERSDSDSGTESSSVSGTEDIGNEADSDDNNQEELSSSSRPSSPSSVERGFKPLQPQPPTSSSHQVVPISGAPTSKSISSQEPVVSSTPSSATGTLPLIGAAPLSVGSIASKPGQPVSTLQTLQQYQPPYLNIPSTLPPITASVPATLLPAASTVSLSSSSTTLSSAGVNNLRPVQHPSPLAVFKPGIGPAPGHISSIGTITNHSGLVPTTCNLTSPLVIPTPLSRASSTGTFIPHAELSVPTVTSNVSATVTSNSAKTLVPTTAETVITTPSSRSTASLPGSSVLTTSSSSTNNSSSNSHGRMQDQSEEIDKKPVVPPPGAYLPQHPGGVPFAPYHPYYYPHPGAPHLPPHLHQSVAMSVASTSGNSHPPPPPVPSLVPIKKEPHSPPPPLKPSQSSSELSSSTSTSSSSSLMLHRPHPEPPSKLPHGFPQPGLTSTAPLPPPPLTVIDHRDSSKSDDLSKSDSYSKDNPRGLPPSPHRPESLPASVLQHRESRLDSNLSVLRESREIGLVGGLNPPPPGQQLPGAPHKDDPRSLPAAFQPYSHHPHSSSSSSVSSLAHHASNSVLQVPQPHLSSDQPHSSQSMSSDSAHLSSRPAPNPDIEAIIKKEPITVEIDIDEDDDDDNRGGSTTPGPTPTVCNREIYKSNSAIFMKVFDRGERNQCSRTDFIFRPLPDSNLAKKREERIRKHSATVVKEEKKRVETPPRATSASEGQKSSSSALTSSSNHPPHSISVGSSSSAYAERHTPRPFADTPALRQLHEYARPHVYGQDLTRAPYSLGGLPHPHPMDPLMSYRLGMYPPGSRERLEMELERDKRERDAREREMRERELRDLELREKMKQDMELKPGLDRLLPPGAANQLTDPNWLDIQRRMGFPPGSAGHLMQHAGPSVSAAGAHVPGVYPPVSLASDLLAREREKLDRLDGAAVSAASANSSSEHLSSRMVYQYYSQRLTSEQHVFMQRVVNECYLRTKPESRPIIDPNHLIYQFSRADPLAAGPSASVPVSSSNPLSVLPPGMAPHPLFAASAGSREELLQRELYSRGGPFLDPALAHQLSAQAAAHEALQRHIAMERERFGSSGHLPH